MESVTRRHLLAGAAAAGLASAVHIPGASAARPMAGAKPDLSNLEARYGRRLGVFAQNLSTGAAIEHRADERFPVLSVFKTVLAALVLETMPPAGLHRRLTWRDSDVVENSPVTAVTVRNGLTIGQLCEATVTRSDNTAANVLLRELGGPAQITEYLRGLGDPVTRLDRWEPDLNSAVPGDDRDTTSPRAIAATYETLIIGRSHRQRHRDRLLEWLLANQTTSTRFGAGVPAGWRLADKTGAGQYGTRNDVGVAWTPDGAPLVLAALTAGDNITDVGQDALLADVAAYVTDQLVS